MEYINLKHNKINFLSRLPSYSVIFIFFSILWTHDSEKIFCFNGIFLEKLFKVINFWKHLYVSVLQIVQKRISQSPSIPGNIVHWYCFDIFRINNIYLHPWLLVLVFSLELSPRILPANKDTKSALWNKVSNLRPRPIISLVTQHNFAI